MKELEKNKPSFLVEIREGRIVRMELKIETDSVIINSSSDESYGRMNNAIFYQLLDETHSSPGLHAAAGPGLAEECATLV